MKIPLSSVNITEEVNRTGVWKTVNNVNAKEASTVKEPKSKDKRFLEWHNVTWFGYISSICIVPLSRGVSSKDKSNRKRGQKKDAISNEENQRLSTMNEEEEEEPQGITIKVDQALWRLSPF